MKISIIIPTFNEELTIGKLIDILRKNSDRNNVEEIIIVDGGSSDNTLQVAKEKRVKFLQSNRKGRGPQLNLGGKIAIGDILFFIHADCFPPANFDKLILKNCLKHNYSGCFRLKFDRNHPILNYYSWFSKFNLKIGRGGDQGLFVHRKIFSSVNGYNENYSITEDLDITQKIRQKYNFQVLRKNMMTSSRKYKKYGILRLQLKFGILYLIYYLKFPHSVYLTIYRKFFH